MSLLAKSEKANRAIDCSAKADQTIAAVLYREYGTVQQLLKRLNAGCLDTVSTVLSIMRFVAEGCASQRIQLSVRNSSFILERALMR